MRTIFTLVGVAVVAGGLVATIQVPNSKGVTRVLETYQADPAATMKILENGILECAPEIAESPVGLRYVKTLLTPYYIKSVEMRAEGKSREAVVSGLLDWVKTNRPEVLDLQRDELGQIAYYLKKIGNDDVENCVISSVRFGGQSDWKPSDG